MQLCGSLESSGIPPTLSAFARGAAAQESGLSHCTVVSYIPSFFYKLNQVNKFRPTAVEVRHGQTKHMQVKTLLTCNIGRYRLACGNRTVSMTYMSYDIRDSSEYVNCKRHSHDGRAAPKANRPCSYPPPMKALEKYGE